MDSVSAAHAASTSSTTASRTTRSTSRTADGKDFATLYADAKRDLKRGETLSKVTGHDYGRIKGGTRDGECVNLTGNARSGQAFDLIWRDGRQFHVYGGSGADHKVVEVGRKAASTTTTTGGTDTTSSTGGTSTTGTTDCTASTGSTSTSGTSTSSGTATDSTTASDVSSSARS